LSGRQPPDGGEREARTLPEESTGETPSLPGFLADLPRFHPDRPTGSKAILDSGMAMNRLCNFGPGFWVVSPYSGWVWVKWADGRVGWVPAKTSLPKKYEVPALRKKSVSESEDSINEFWGHPFSRVFQRKIGLVNGTWRIRNSGVSTIPESSPETWAVVRACRKLGIEVRSFSSGSPSNADEHRLEAAFLDGGVNGRTGNYFFLSGAYS